MTAALPPRRIVVTGAAGFIGRHVLERLGREPNIEIRPVTRQTTPAQLDAMLGDADAVLHLAGVNRPSDPAEFASGNAGLTKHICERLANAGRAVTVVFSSSSQAELDNPYGISKRGAEEALAEYAQTTGAHVVVFRLPNVFGKWCRPNYNSFVATLCHGVARGEPYHVNDRARALSLVYIDEVVAALVDAALAPAPLPAGRLAFGHVGPVFHTTLGALVDLVESFRASRTTLRLPDFSDPFTLRLYPTYLSYLAPEDFAYSLDRRDDARGELAEFVKSPGAGQIFISRTHPGITRGNHYHHTKTEKFLVVEGRAVIRFRQLESDDVIEHRVAGEDFRVVDIPPGYTHSIENVGDTEMVVVFWASEVFDPARPDTYMLPVLVPQSVA